MEKFHQLLRTSPKQDGFVADKRDCRPWFHSAAHGLHRMSQDKGEKDAERARLGKLGDLSEFPNCQAQRQTLHVKNCVFQIFTCTSLVSFMMITVPFCFHYGSSLDVKHTVLAVG